ncbi:hypothetical protein [Confluentibacter citreus]|uniref:hypothetical protein n=1 Tax=Confluentibacter citreus TaxID=2007307 RepID=UPI000C288226|nr:hypothetical protein [Confluentibacter citreus]
MTKKMASLTWMLLLYFSVFGQNEPKSDNTIMELNAKLEALTKLYNSLKIQLDLTQTTFENSSTSVNSKVENVSKELDSKYSDLTSRADNVEQKLKITDIEKEEFQKQNITRNKEILENFHHYIKFYGDKYSQLDEKLTSEELAVEFRKIINPQSGSLGFKLSDKLQVALSKNYKDLIDKVMKDGSKKNETQSKVSNILSTVTSVLDNPIVNDVTGIIPFASTIKSIIGTTSGLVLSALDPKEIKNEYKNTLLTEIKNSQTQILNELNQIISFYDHMAKLDNEYLMRLQNIRTDVGILGIELREFCFGLETPLRKMDPAFTLDTNLTTREITIQISNKIEALKANSAVNKTHLVTISNMAFEMKVRSRDLYNSYREIQELKIIANNKFVEDFNRIVKENSITTSPDIITKKLSDKNIELIDKMKTNHKIDKTEFEKHLNKIYELN